VLDIASSTGREEEDDALRPSPPPDVKPPVSQLQPLQELL
jgi:hypothetical protein